MLAERLEPTERPINVLVILVHPRADSFCGALAEAFCQGARAAGVQLRRLDLSGLDFDPHLHTPSPNDQPLEDDLCRARELLLWADHLVIVYPTWWGTAPALLKGFLDRLMAPGFAFRTCEGGIGYQGLLQDRSAQLITTMDTPPLVHRLLYRQPGKNALARATLGFCGMRPVRSLVFGSVKNASTDQREAWLARAERQGRRLQQGRITRMERLRHKTGAWLRSLRLQFYPMSWVAYAIGALAASPGSPVLGTSVFWVGYLCLFLLEVATVLINEVVDLPTDQRNRYFNAFTGGSRVLVDGSLSLREVKAGIGVALLGRQHDLAALAVRGGPGHHYRGAWRPDRAGDRLHGAATEAQLSWLGRGGCGGHPQYRRAAVRLRVPWRCLERPHALAPERADVAGNTALHHAVGHTGSRCGCLGVQAHLGGTPWIQERAAYRALLRLALRSSRAGMGRLGIGRWCLHRHCVAGRPSRRCAVVALVSTCSD